MVGEKEAAIIIISRLLSSSPPGKSNEALQSLWLPSSCLQFSWDAQKNFLPISPLFSTRKKGALTFLARGKENRAVSNGRKRKEFRVAFLCWLLHLALLHFLYLSRREREMETWSQEMIQHLLSRSIPPPFLCLRWRRRKNIELIVYFSSFPSSPQGNLVLPFRSIFLELPALWGPSTCGFFSSWLWGENKWCVWPSEKEGGGKGRE